MSNEILDVDVGSFDRILRSRKPVIVDFWAQWCGPCKAIAPMLEELAERYNGKVRVARVNVDHSPTLSSEYQIRSIPTFLVFRRGEVVHRRVGGGTLHEMTALFDEATAS